MQYFLFKLSVLEMLRYHDNDIDLHEMMRLKYIAQTVYWLILTDGPHFGSHGNSNSVREQNFALWKKNCNPSR